MQNLRQRAKRNPLVEHVLHLDDTISDLATQLRRLGDTDPLEIRRATAVAAGLPPLRAGGPAATSARRR